MHLRKIERMGLTEQVGNVSQELKRQATEGEIFLFDIWTSDDTVHIMLMPDKYTREEYTLQDYITAMRIQKIDAILEELDKKYPHI